LERQVNDVALGKTSDVETGVGVFETRVGSGGFNVGSGGLEGAQAVRMTRNVKNDATSFIVRRVFILWIIPTDQS
jgi:hypothetical protein